MPINELHPVMNAPKENITLWRYIDIPSFFSMVSDEALAFVRADLMEDKYEGTFPQITAQILDSQAAIMIKTGQLGEQYREFSKILCSEKETAYLNCWCKEQNEMVHMWKIYSKENGIALQTTYNEIKESIMDDEDIYPTEIQYIDFKKDFIDWKSNGLTVYTIKRIEYKSENEFRLIICFPKEIQKKYSQVSSVVTRKQFYQDFPVVKCKVDIKKLIKNIHLSPFAPKWYEELIRNTLNKMGYNGFTIHTSIL